MRLKAILAASVAITASWCATAHAQAATEVEIVLPAGPDRLDPCETPRSVIGRIIKQNVVATLVELNYQDGSIILRLAESWTQDSPTHWTLIIRPMPSPAPPILGTLESALYAADLVAAEAFWSGVIGLEAFQRQPGRHVFFRVPPATLSATGAPQVLLVFDPAATETPRAPDARLPVPPHGAHGPGHFCLAVAATDLDAWRAHLEAHRIAIEADFRWPNGARSIYCRDPAGNSIELAEPGIWGG